MEEPKPRVKGKKKPSETTAANQAIQLAEESCEFWKTPYDDAYVTIRFGDHVEHHLVRSRAFRAWLRERYHRKTAKVCNGKVLSEVLDHFEGIAELGEVHKVFVRIGQADDGAVYLDLGDETRRAVRVTPDGWKLVPSKDVPIKFRRSPRMLPLPEPDRESSVEDLERLRDFANVTDEDWPLVKGWTLNVLNPTGPYLGLVLIGEYGTGKSRTAEFVRSLVDPIRTEEEGLPKDDHDFALRAMASHIVDYGNLGDSMPAAFSDRLCRVATGGSFGTRRYYRDDEERLFDLTGPIVLNGIGAFATRGDLLDRVVVLRLPRLEKRRPEAKLRKAFKQAHPKLLGALLDAAVLALRNQDTVELEEDTRMVDAVAWIVAGAEGLGITRGEFFEALRRVRGSANETVLGASVFGGVLRGYLDRVGACKLTPKELLGRLEHFARMTEDSSDWTRLQDWPKSYQAVANQIDRVGPNLRECGYTVSGPHAARGPNTERRSEYHLAAPGREADLEGLERGELATLLNLEHTGAL